MNFVTFALLAIACMSAFSVLTVLLFTRYGAGPPVKKLAEAGDNIRTDLEQLSSKIANLENEINQLKVQFVSTRIQLVSMTQKKAVTPKIAASTEEDTWTRSESLLSIAPTITEPLDNDTWVRNGQASDIFEPANGDALLSLPAPAEHDAEARCE